MKKTDCDSCVHFVYDEEWDCYECEVSMDEDELMRFMQDKSYHCRYYRLGDDYAVVRKQN